MLFWNCRLKKNGWRVDQMQLKIAWKAVQLKSSTKTWISFPVQLWVKSILSDYNMHGMAESYICKNKWISDSGVDCSSLQTRYVKETVSLKADPY